MYYVYKMIHVPTGRVYVGQRKLPKGKTPETDGYHGSGKIWKRIYKAHPEECVKIVLEVVKTKKEVDAIERKFIAHYRSIMGEKCVNIADGGDGCGGWNKGMKMSGGAWNKGMKMSEEFCKRNSEVHKGQHHSEYTKRKISEALSGEKNPFFGKKHSEASREKMREAQRGEKNHFFGKKHSEATRKKISEAKKGKKGKKGKKHSEATRKKISEANSGENHPNYGKHLSEETKRKISETLKNRTKIK